MSTTRDNITQIVPLYVPELIQEGVAPSAQAGATPKLTYRNGPLLTSVNVFTVFWGSAWQQAPQSDLVTQLNQYFDTILTSSLLDEMSEYSVQGQTIGHGTRGGTLTITDADPQATIDDSAVQQLLQQRISAGQLPAATPNTLYFVYLPSGVTITQGGSASCSSFCGYHDAINGQIFYAVMPSPDCQGCQGGLTTFDSLTSTSSHELCEAITDAIPGQGWYDDVNGEIGDICAWKTKKIGNYTVQLEWSNQANNCI